ncbi:hypothetical protein CBR_g32391 [Chara braunii]|uniref:Uncharacterized protein n=1 Tax=Chara braunii TaxID=69332 RepID=A0A388JYE9_CHABU|nr:hypothetical protein CBR_g32391 [Chara braunii]|eukprot:GBG62808.1 hypothetical protein CBR_g32391 [Chara braunii]
MVLIGTATTAGYMGILPDGVLIRGEMMVKATLSRDMMAVTSRDVLCITRNGPRRRSSGISINEGASQDLGFDRINRGKKAVVAGPGKEGREKYIEDLIYELMLKTKHELEELCKKDRIKYVNKKITTAALAKLRAIDAYGEDEDDEDSEEDTQEENPS